MRPARVPVLVRRLATAFALLAMLALGLHETAHAADTFIESGQSLVGQLHLGAVPDHGKAGGGPGKHPGAVPHSCHICGAVMPMPQPTVPTLVPVAALPNPATAVERTGFDPGGPRRPPRTSLIA